MQTAAPTPTRKKSAIQEPLLDNLCRKRTAVTVFLVNGFQLRGEVRGYDPFVVVLYADGKQQMVYKHAISTIVPHQPVSWDRTDPD
jgi:host factor-I protein